MYVALNANFGHCMSLKLKTGHYLSHLEITYEIEFYTSTNTQVSRTKDRAKNYIILARSFLVPGVMAYYE